MGGQAAPETGHAPVTLGAPPRAGTPAIAYWLDLLSTPLLFVAAFVAGLASVFHLADAALVQHAVTPDELMEGNGLITGSGAVADAAGRSVAGWLAAVAGASNTLLVQAGASGISLVSIQRLDVKEIVRPSWSCWLLVLLTLGESEIWLGLLLAAASVGGAVGGITAHGVGERVGSGPLWRWSMVPGVLGYASLLLMTPGWGMVRLFVMGASVSWNIVVGSSFRQRVCPPGMMGRLGAASRTVSWGCSRSPVSSRKR